MIYIAAPLFSEMEKNYIDKIVHIISQKLELNQYNDFYVPHRDNIGMIDSDIYDKNIKYLNNCTIMIAILDGKDVDAGTAFKIGYFESQNKIVLGLLTDKRSYEENGELNLKLNIMIFGSLLCGNLVFNNIDDLTEKLYDILITDDFIENFILMED